MTLPDTWDSLKLNKIVVRDDPTFKTKKYKNVQRPELFTLIPRINVCNIFTGSVFIIGWIILLRGMFL